MAVVFMATISMLQSAIQIAGDGGARIKLDIDDSGMDAVTALSALRGQLLKVTVESESDIQACNKAQKSNATAHKRRSTRHGGQAQDNRSQKEG